jgi:hypothetical protein
LGILSQVFEVEGNGIADASQHHLARFTGGHTTWKVGHMGREVAFGFFDHDGKGLAHGKRRPDCLAMLLRVPGARPSLLLETSDDRANLHPLLLASALSFRSPEG